MSDKIKALENAVGKEKASKLITAFSENVLEGKASSIHEQITNYIEYHRVDD